MKLLIVAVLCVVASAQNTRKWTTFQCRNGVLGPNDARMSEIGQCKPANPDCVTWCQLEALGLIGPDGMPSPNIYDKWVESVLPQRHRTFAKGFFRDCWNKFGVNIQKGDATCKHAKLFGDCTWTIQPNLTC